MNPEQLDAFLTRYTESEKRHRADPTHALSARYQVIPRVEFAGRQMYLFSFKTLLEGRFVCVNKESRFTHIPEHIHTVIELLYVYGGRCTQIIDGREVQMAQGDICLLDTNVPHSVGYLGEEDIIITIEMQKDYLTQGFLQRLGDNRLINGFLMNALSQDAAHDQYLLFKKRAENPIHGILQHILCEYYDPQLCSDRALDAYMVLLFCEILRQYRSQSFSGDPNSRWKVVDILDYIENHTLTATLESTAQAFGFHPNYLSAYIKKETGRSFKELVILQRMNQACFYLTNTQLPIYEIAQKIGYDNLGFFYKKFERLYHMTPAQWRELQHKR